jgi:TetR/AcrR family transcriptional repressor of mexJK operon
MTIGAAPRGPGRPKDRTKHDAILDAARRLFFERGVEAVPIEAVAAEAGVSKVTVYGHFGDKLTLFEAVVLREVAAMDHGLATPDPTGKGIEDRLVAFGMALMGFLTRPDIAAFERMLGPEADRHPELARRFFDAGPGRCRALLAAAIAEAASAGQLAPDDPVLAAEDLLSLWQRMLPITRRLGLEDAPDTADVTERVRRGVHLFMRGHGVNASPSRASSRGPGASGE